MDIILLCVTFVTLVKDLKYLFASMLVRLRL